MKSYDEVTNNLLERRDKYNEVQRAKKKTIVRISSFVSCFVIVAVLGVGIWQGGWLDFNSLPIANPSTQEGNNVESIHNNTSQETIINNSTQNQPTNQTTPPSSEQSTSGQNSEALPDGGNIGSGGDIGDGSFIPVLPFDGDIIITGEAITDKEAEEYFTKNKKSIIGALTSSGVSSNSIKFSDKGYCHVNYNGEEGKSFEIRQNYRDYLVYSGNELIAIITLYKENGEIFNTQSFGAKWFDDYNAYLQSHKGEKLVFAYAGWLEIIIAPDNTYFNPMGYDVSKYLEGVEKPYDVFYHESATYTP